MPFIEMGIVGRRSAQPSSVIWPGSSRSHAPNYPMIGDPNLKISKLYDMLPENAGDTCDGRTAADNQTVRNVYVIGPDKKIKLVIVYRMTTGRNFDGRFCG